jgi:hypothetical protein
MKNPALLTLVCSGLLLASCNRNTPPQPDSAAGKLVELKFAETTGAASYSAWSGGAGQVIASVEGKGELVKTVLKADGSFSLTLPRLETALLVAADPTALTPGLPENCTSSLEVSGAADARSAVATFGVQAQKSGAIAPFALREAANSATLEAGAYVYFDKAAGLSGKITCIKNNVSVTGDINVQFRPGWNKLSLSVAATATEVKVSLTTGTLPANWVYLGDSQAAQPLGSQSLKTLKSLNLPFFR